jgi:hypothetical protein
MQFVAQGSNMLTGTDRLMKPIRNTRPDLAHSCARPMVAQAHASGVGFFLCLPILARSIRSF